MTTTVATGTSTSTGGAPHPGAVHVRLIVHMYMCSTGTGVLCTRKKTRTNFKSYSNKPSKEDKNEQEDKNELFKIYIIFL